MSSPEDLAEMEYPAKGVVTASGQEPLTIYKSRDNAEGRNTREAVKFSFDKVSPIISVKHSSDAENLLRSGIPTGRRPKRSL